MASIKRAGRGARERGRRAARGGQPRDQKVTARFTAEEYEAIVALGDERKEKLSSLVRDLVLATVDEVRDDLKKKRRRQA